MTRSAVPAACLENIRRDRRSPNYDTRKLPLDLIILHYTDMLTAEAALDRLCDPASKVSAHFLIAEDGSVHALVDTSLRAWHAGVSVWQGVTDINSRSIGIELANPGHSHGYRPFPPAQIASLTALLAHLTKSCGIAPLNVIGHSDIAPLRKEDPGALFPWKDLAAQGFGRWPREPLQMPDVVPPIAAFQQNLQSLGYGCPATGVLDDETRAVIRAFQRHYQPDTLTGIPDRTTAALIAGLLADTKLG